MSFLDGYNDALRYNGIFTPKPGTYQITVLEEPKETFYNDKENDREIPQWELKIRMKNEMYVWFIPQGKTVVSIDIQLKALHKHKRLINVPFTLNVLNNMGKNSYTIIEAQELLLNDKSKME